MNNKLILSILVVAVFNLTACYSFQSVSEDDAIGLNLPEDKPIRLKLKNGNEIRAKAYHHTYVDSSVNYIIGTGKKIVDEKVEMKYEGRLYDNRLDTCEILQIDEKECLSCFMKDNSRIVFEDEKYLRITSKSEKGLWLTGDIYIPNEISYTTEKISGLINQNDITEIKIEKLDTEATILLSIGLAAVVGFLIYAAVVGSNFKVFDNPN
jgi:hypothetical protein